MTPWLTEAPVSTLSDYHHALNLVITTCRAVLALQLECLETIAHRKLKTGIQQS